MLPKIFWDNVDKATYLSRHPLTEQGKKVFMRFAVRAMTNCGTGELQKIEYAQNLKELVADMAQQMLEGNRGMFVYYNPHNESNNTDIIKKWGFTKVAEFTNFNYLTARANKGATSMYVLLVEEKEIEKLKTLLPCMKNMPKTWGQPDNYQPVAWQ